MINPRPITDSDYDISDKVCLYGDSGSGKTHLLATIGGKGLLIDAEKGTKTLRKIKSKKLYKNVKNIDGQLVDNHEDVMDVINWIKGVSPKYDWIGLDSISDLAFESLGAYKKQYADKRNAYQEMESDMNEIIRALRDLKGYKVIVLAGQKRIEDEDTRRTMYRPAMPSQNTSRSLEYWFNTVLCAQCERIINGQDIDKNYYLQCDSTPNLFAKNRGSVLNMYEEANLSKIFKKITD